jgi:hypothetical protein
VAAAQDPGVAMEALSGNVGARRGLRLGVGRDSTALAMNAIGPNAANSGPAMTKPSSSPASVAASKRATAFPRMSSSAAVAKAMNPRIDGTDAAVEAPSRSRVKPMTGRLTVSAVMTTATAPKAGPTSMIRRWPTRSESTPKMGERISSDA